MRAKLIFCASALSVVVFGLALFGGVVGAKYLGVLAKKNAEPVLKETIVSKKKDLDPEIREELAAIRRTLTAMQKKREPEQPKFKEGAILVLVAKYDLPKGVSLTEDDVRVRELLPEETAMYQQNRGKFMSPNASAVRMRIPSVNIKDDLPLLRSQFIELDGLPWNRPLDPLMRRLTLSVPDLATALQLGDCVEVWLTSKVKVSPNGEETIKRAQLAKECFVIARVKTAAAEGANPSEAPVTLMLETNAYRAALIEFCKTKGKGEISLTATKPEDGRGTTGAPRMTFSELRSREYRDEDQRIEAIRNGELVISDSELHRIFGVYPSQPPKVDDLPPTVSKELKEFPNGLPGPVLIPEKMPKGADKQGDREMERITARPREVVPPGLEKGAKKP